MYTAYDAETRREYLTRKAREYRSLHPERYSQSRKRYYEKNREKRLAASKEYAQSHREDLAAKRREYRKACDKDRVAARARRKSIDPSRKAKANESRRKYEQKRMSGDPQYAVSKAIRCRMYLALKKGWKAGPTVSLLGCSVADCMKHLEGQFAEGMSWKNWGVGRDNSTWHIDHIRPVTAFDLTNEEGQKKAFHYTNLRPMWGSDNIRKGGVPSIRLSTPSST